MHVWSVCRGRSACVEGEVLKGYVGQESLGTPGNCTLQIFNTKFEQFTVGNAYILQVDMSATHDHWRSVKTLASYQAKELHAAPDLMLEQ